MRIALVILISLASVQCSKKTKTPLDKNVNVKEYKPKTPQCLYLSDLNEDDYEEEKDEDYNPISFEDIWDDQGDSEHWSSEADEVGNTKIDDVSRVDEQSQTEFNLGDKKKRKLPSETSNKSSKSSKKVKHSKDKEVQKIETVRLSDLSNFTNKPTPKKISARSNNIISKATPKKIVHRSEQKVKKQENPFSPEQMPKERENIITFKQVPKKQENTVPFKQVSKGQEDVKTVTNLSKHKAEPKGEFELKKLPQIKQDKKQVTSSKFGNDSQSIEYPQNLACNLENRVILKEGATPSQLSEAIKELTTKTSEEIRLSKKRISILNKEFEERLLNTFPHDVATRLFAWQSRFSRLMTKWKDAFEILSDERNTWVKNAIDFYKKNKRKRQGGS